MKKRISFVLILISSALLFAGEINFLSFNMNTRSRTAEQAADMIKESGADFVFLQEVWLEENKDAALHKICSLLGKSEWNFVSSSSYSLKTIQKKGDETYKSGGNGQNNAVIYNSTKLSVKNLADEIGFTDFSGDYLFDKNNVILVEITPADNKSQKCIAINVHLPFNDRPHRKRDLETLEKLYAHFKLKSAVIIAGDFNYYRRDLTKRNFDIVDGTENYFTDPNFGIPTTLSTKGTASVLFASDYDHFILNKKLIIKK
ncbi:endonuclease/exonuclease/phosphatase family protein, partial [Treponema sp.]|uniref:endonuclease/exonuclease/phosphatase family protein n=1 Tax=Treponema sp. TaxID=166 RepID=UPI0038901C2D